MKTTILKRFIALGVCGSALLTAQAEKVQIEQLPQGVQEKIRAHTGSSRIQDIDMQTKEGQVTYQVGFKQNGEHTELLFNSEGRLLNREGGTALAPAKVEFNELPAAVQQMVRTRIQQGDINDIDRKVQGGDVTYEVGFKHNGVQQELLLSETGRILRDVAFESVGAPAGVISGRGEARMLSPTRVQLSSAQKVELSEIPAEAAQAILRTADGARIEDLEVGTWNNMRVYQAAFKSGGQHVELQVAPSGLMVYNPLLAQGGTPSGEMLSRTQVQLSGAQKVELGSIPAEAAQKILQIAGGANIQDLEVGTWNNMRVYQAAFKSEGRNVELQVDAKGRVVHNPMQAAGRGALGRANSELFPENRTRRDSELFPENQTRRGRDAVLNRDNLPVNTLVALNSSQVIGRDDLPQAVTGALSQHAPGADLQRIERGIWTDRIVYQFNFIDNGRLHHLQLDQTGKLVHDTRFPNRQ